MKRKACLSIRANDAGQSVLNFAASRFQYYNIDQWQKEIQEGRLLLNGQPAQSFSMLNLGDVLEYKMPKIEEPPVNMDYDILFEDEHFMAINKPGNLPCHPGGRYFNHTLWAALKKTHKNKSKNLGFVHRLDRETSGVVLIAKTPKDAQICQNQFNAGYVEKIYWVIVEGGFPAQEICADGFLGQDKNSLVRKKQRFYTFDNAPENAKSCSTKFRIIKKTKDLSLVEARPETGRLHQIRATLCGLGYPVAGDKIYGLDDTFFLRFIQDQLNDFDKKRLKISRQALHAASISIRHPQTMKMLKFNAPMPQDMARLMLE